MFIPFKQTPNYSKGTGIKKTAIVWHGTLGAYNGAVSWLSRNGGNSSAHFIVGRKEGEIIQLVDMKDIAWHAGNVSNPIHKFINFAKGQHTNPNRWTVGIEFCWGYDIDKDGDIDKDDKTLNDWQMKCAKEIHDRFTGMFNVPVTPNNVFTHSDIASYKSDNLSDDINRYFSMKTEVIDPEIKKTIDEYCATPVKEQSSILSKLLKLFKL